MTEGQQEATEAPVKFTIGVHSWIEVQQTSHGVRHDDYKQYQSYCTRRLSRLRHDPAVKKELVHSTRYVSNTKGRPRHAFCARKVDKATYSEDERKKSDVDNNNTEEEGEGTGVAAADDEEPLTTVPHENFLWVLLVSAERSWAHAGELQRCDKRNRPHILRRLAKAKQFAARLEACAKLNADEVTYKECQAYAGWMKGSWALEKGEFKAASLEFAKAMSLYHDLAQEATKAVDGGESLKDPEHLERQDLFVTRAETVLRPLFRYCQYELREAGEETVEEPIWSDTTVTMTSSVAEESYTYRGQAIQIENKDLHVLMLKLQSLSTAIAGTTKQESTFLQSLSTLDDALEIIKTSMQSLEKMKAGPAVNAKRHQLDLWRGYLQSKKINLVMDHTEGLLKCINSHGERVHVYVTLLKHAQSLLQLPGPKASEGGGDGGSANVVEEEDEFALQVQATVLRIRALKCYHMGMYYYHECEQLEEAAALLEHSESLTKRALEEIAACDEDMVHAEDYVTELQLLLDEKLMGGKICVAAAQLAVHCQDIIGAPPKPKTIKTGRPLMQRLDDWDAGEVMADVPPMFMPIPQKPVFYDLAWDYVSDMTDQLEVIQNHIDEQTGAKEEAVPELDAETTSSSGGGLFGWLTGK